MDAATAARITWNWGAPIVDACGWVWVDGWVSYVWVWVGVPVSIVWSLDNGSRSLAHAAHAASLH